MKQHILKEITLKELLEKFKNDPDKQIFVKHYDETFEIVNIKDILFDLSFFEESDNNLEYYYI